MFEEEASEWQELMKEAIKQATTDETRHTPVLERAAPNYEERQPQQSTVDKMMKKQERKRCGWPGMRFTPLPKPKKGKGSARKNTRK